VLINLSADSQLVQQRYSFRVRRENAFGDSVDGILERSADRELRNPSASLNTVLDEGTMYGPAQGREYLRIVYGQIFDPAMGLFVSNQEVPQYMKVSEGGSRNQLKAVGKLLALSITSNQAVGVSLPVFFFTRILGNRIELEDIREDEPMLYQTLNYMLTCPESELADMPMTIGSEVITPTLETRQELVNRRLNLLIPDEAMRIIAEGFTDVIPLHILREYISARDLKKLILGTPMIDVEDLIQGAVWSSYSARNWMDRVKNVLRSFSQTELHEFLRFATNLVVVPSGGFMAIQPSIKINRGTETEHLPRVFQCMNSVWIPEYQSETQMREKLLLAFYGSDWGL
jgi:hypothetical protein